MIRDVDLRGAVSVDTITMIGIGPPITLALVDWIGALVSTCDGVSNN